MTEVNVDHRLVQVHFSKPLIENGEDLGAEYTDQESEADQVAVYLETRFKDENGKEISEFDISEEKEFFFNELGKEQAKEQAEKFASELADKYKTTWEWY